MFKSLGHKIASVVKSISFFSGWNTASEKYSEVYSGSSGTRKITDSVWAVGGIEATAQAVSSLEMKFVSDKDGKDLTTPNALQQQWINLMWNPGTLLTQRQLMEVSSMIFDIEGICFWVLYDEMGQPIDNILTIPSQIIAYGPAKIKPRYASADSDVVIGWDMATKTGQRYLRPWQVIRFWKTNPASYENGLKIIDKIGSTLSLDKGARDVNKGFFENGARPSGILTTTERIDEEQFRSFAAEFRSRYSMKENSGKIPGIPHPFKFEPSTEAKDMDFANLHTLTRDEIFGAHRVPKHFLGVNDSINYATAEVLDRIFWLLVVKPKISVFEDVINNRLLIGTGMEIVFSFDKVPIIAKDEIEVRKKKLQLATYYFNLGYPTNWINAKLGLGMDEIKEAWANEPHDPTLSAMVGMVGESGGDSGSSSGASDSKGLKSPHKRSLASDSGQKKNLDDVIGDAVSKGIIDALSTIKVETDDDSEEAILQKALQGDLDAQAKYCEIVERATVASLTPVMQRTVERYIKRLEKSQIERIEAYLSGEEFAQKAEGDRNLTIESIDSILFNETKWDSILISDSKGLHLKAYKSGIARAKKELGGFSVFNQSDEQAAQAAAEITNKVVRINETIREQLQKTITESIKNGASTPETIENVKGVFQMSQNRANTIARTEMGHAANEGRWDAMSVEVETKQWLSAEDNNVRESHVKYSQMGSQPIDYEYAPGLRFPQDSGGSAEEVINCRCVIVKGN